MHEEFWHERWQRQQIGFHQGEVNSWLQEYWSKLKINSDGSVLVPLSGKSIDMLWLRGNGHPVLGIELSPLAVRDFFSENQLSPQIAEEPGFKRWTCDGITLLEGNFFSLQASHLKTVAAVYDRAALIALPPPMRQEYVAHLIKTLPQLCPMLLITLEYDEAKMEGPPFSVSEAEVHRLYQEHYAVELIESVEVIEAEENIRFKKFGHKSLRETVYLLTPHST